MIGKLDQTLFASIQGLGLQAPWFDALAIFIATSFGILITGIAIVFVIFHHEKPRTPLSWSRLKRRMGEACVILGSAFFSWLVVVLLKFIFASPRPFITFTDLQTLLVHGSYDSFPSGHATFFAALGTALFIYHPRIGGFYLFGAVLIGLARIVVGVHFPFDIIAGFLLGIAVAFFVYKTLRPLGKRLLGLL